MYSEEDINGAVAAGALSADAATSFRAHMSTVRAMPRSDEENFRLINSFNDIFVSIGVIILLIAMGSIGGAITGSPNDSSLFGSLFPIFLPSALVAGVAWALAEIFTRQRRMALPSILLLVAFVGGVLAASFALISFPIGLIAGIHTISEQAIGQSKIGDAMGAVLIVLIMAGAAALTTYFSWLHWKRFMVPITIAAGAAAVVACAIGAAALAVQIMTDGEGRFPILALVFFAGLCVFAVAMRWDMSDRERTTRRSDVAFWLHLLAAPMIAHPLFYSLGVMDGGGAVGVGGALGVIAIYVLFGLVALAIDRRALLVSALAYVLAALTFLFDRFGAVELNFALTALVIGSALLTLAGFWTPIRAKVVALLPGNVQMRLPQAGMATA